MLVIPHVNKVVRHGCDLLPIHPLVEIIGRLDVDRQDKLVQPAFDGELPDKLYIGKRIGLLHVFKVEVDAVKSQFQRIIDKCTNRIPS